MYCIIIDWAPCESGFSKASVIVVVKSERPFAMDIRPRSKVSKMPLQGRNRWGARPLISSRQQLRAEMTVRAVFMSDNSVVPLYFLYIILTMSLNPSIYSCVIKLSCCIHSFPSLQPAEEKNSGQFSWHMTPNMSCHYG